VHAHIFDDFWEDLGTIRAYWEVSLALCDDQPKFEFHSPRGVIYTRVRNLPPSRISEAKLEKVRLAEGCVIQAGALIRRSIIGVRSRICRDVCIENTVLTGADRIESDADREDNARRGRIDLGVGAGTIIRGAIIDKDCRIGKKVHIENDRGIPFLHEDTNKNAMYYIRDGIIVIPRGTTIPDGTRIPSLS
jgi:glucose-1-phosphate adenylyltransferase